MPLRQTIEALRTVTTRPGYTTATTKFAKHRLDSWTRKDVRASKARFPHRSAIFIGKPPKEFNLAEVARLIRIDAAHSGYKFRYVSNSPELADITTAPLMRRLLNNGLSYTVHGNTPQFAKILLDEAGATQHEVQTTLVEYHTPGEPLTKVTYKELALAPAPTRVPINVDDSVYQLETPSIALLVRMEGVGVPVNHPEHDKLANKRVPHPLIPQQMISFHSIPDREDTTLIALIPSHIMAHRAWFSNTVSHAPGPVSYNGEIKSLTELTEVLCKKLNVPQPFMITAPFITSRYFMAGEPVTISSNGGEILDSDKFPRIENADSSQSVSAVNELRLVSRKVRYPLSIIRSGEVYDMLKFTPQSRKFKVGLITADMIRSCVLDHDMIDKQMLSEKRNVLEVLHLALGVVEEMGFVFSKDMYIRDLFKLLNTTQDNNVELVVLKKFYDAVEDNEKIGEFAHVFGQYMVLLEAKTTFGDGLSQETKEFVTKFLYNIIVRLLHDPARRLFPEFSAMWSIEFKMYNPHIDRISANLKTNKWNNYITFPVESITTDPAAENLLATVGQICGAQKFPQPFNFSFEVHSSLSKYKSILEHISSKFYTPQITFVETFGHDSNKHYDKSELNELTEEAQATLTFLPYRSIPNLNKLDKFSKPWYQIFDNLQLTKINNKSISLIKKDLRFRMGELGMNSISLSAANSFINHVLSPQNLPNDFGGMMQLYLRDKKKEVEQPVDESFKSVGEEHVEKKINEFI